ncbi:MAG: DUF362 domain-containing protein [Desulfovibrio sp.]|jgi:uncharacterized Fe-S center protein|nr:DUF362 domain-containing protein [Desulfovibrio sp.]
MTHASLARVFFSGFRARSAKENKISKIERLFDAAGFYNLVESGSLTAIKVHFGEKGNDSFINPIFVRPVVDRLKKIGALPFITDTNTLYSGSRHNAVDHLQTALEHGYGYATVNAPVLIADGLRGGSFSPVAVQGRHFSEVKIADAIVEARSMIVMSHFKGHELAGFGGAVKHLAMGCAPSQGKCDQHASRFAVDAEKCMACGMCMTHCPAQAVSWENADRKPYAVINKENCLGCGECLTVCAPKAVTIDWRVELEPFCERMAEYALGAVSGKKDRVGFFNFLMNITPDCDCAAWSDVPLVPDIGILASSDPVALDMASYDLVNSRSGFAHSRLTTNFAPGEDKFKGVWAYTKGEVQLSHAESLGLGTTQYELVEI